MERRLILAFVLSMAVIFLWNTYIAPPQPPSSAPAKKVVVEPAKPVTPPTAKPSFDEGLPLPSTAMLPDLTAAAQPAAEKPSEVAKPAAPTPPTPPVASAPAAGTVAPAPTTPETPAPVEQTYTLDTPDFRAVFTNRGARLQSYVFKSAQYTVREGDVLRPIDLVSVKEPENQPYTLLLDQANFRYDPNGLFEIEAKDAKSVRFVQKTPQGVLVRKTFRYTGDYTFELTVEVENGAQAAASFFPKLKIVTNQNDEHVQKILFSSGMSNDQVPKAYFDGSLWEQTNRDKLIEPEVQRGQIVWAGIDDRYFLLSVLPPANSRSQISAQSKSMPYVGASGKMQHQYWTALTHASEKQEVAPAAKKTLNYRLFIGPKEYDLLKRIGSNLDESVDFWVLGILAIPMLYILKYAHMVIPNWGIAIIILTLLVKLVTIPLTHKSQVSMQKMSALKPKMDVIKEKYKDDRQAMNEKMMELYRQEGVNPMSGCLPMLIQMPIWFALYRMLQNAVDLYNSAFVPGWIDNLVAPDPYYVLPVLMAVLMWLQQHITPAMDSQQQKMMKWMMPAMMLLFMLVLPAGLVLYIVVNSFMGVLQQMWINRKLPKPEAPKPAKAKA